MAGLARLTPAQDLAQGHWPSVIVLLLAFVCLAAGKSRKDLRLEGESFFVRGGGMGPPAWLSGPCEVLVSYSVPGMPEASSSYQLEPLAFCL